MSDMVIERKTFNTSLGILHLASDSFGPSVISVSNSSVSVFGQLSIRCGGLNMNSLKVIKPQYMT